MRRRLFFLLLLPALSSLQARADDLVTRDGKVYHDYKVLGHDAGFLTIMYSDGGGKIPLSDLPDDLQKQYGYNKQQADAFVQASIAQDRRDRQAIAQEQEQHQQQIAAQNQAEPQAAASPPVTVPSPPAAPALPASAPPSPPVDAAASSSTAPPSQEDIDALKQKIADVRADLVDAQLDQIGMGTSNQVAVEKKRADSAQLDTLKGQLHEMEHRSAPKSLTWEARAALYEQIVQLEDDKDSIEADRGTDIRAKLRAQFKEADDDAEIANLRQTLGDAGKPPLTLTPDQANEIKQKIVDLREDIKAAKADSGRDGYGRGNAQHRLYEDTEQIEGLNEQLAAAHQQ